MSDETERPLFWVVPTEGPRLSPRNEYVGPYSTRLAAIHAANGYRSQNVACAVTRSATRPNVAEVWLVKQEGVRRQARRELELVIAAQLLKEGCVDTGTGFRSPTGEEAELMAEAAGFVVETARTIPHVRKLLLTLIGESS
jgi:hypothetical protein